MIKAHIEIGEDGKFDSYEKWGFIYVGSDNVFSAPLKKQDSISYAGESGEWIDKRAVPDAFTYKIKFVIVAPNNDTENANEKIHAFNQALYNTYGNGVKTLKTITIYNYFKRVKIVGVPTPISEVSSVYRRIDGTVEDCFEIELNVRVDKPDLCDFHLKNEAIPLEIRLVNRNTYDPATRTGNEDDNLYIQFSRPLEPDEHVCLLRRGGSRRCFKSRKCAKARGENNMRSNRWVVFYQTSDAYKNIQWPLEALGRFDRYKVADNFEWDGGMTDYAYLIQDRDLQREHFYDATSFAWGVHSSDAKCLRIYKGCDSMVKLYCPRNSTSADNGITYGIGVYKAAKFKTKFGKRSMVKVKRVSNVCYFRKFAECISSFVGIDLINEDFSTYKLWTSIV